MEYAGEVEWLYRTRREMREAIIDVLRAADAKDQPATSKNIPASLIERLREVSR